MVTIFLVYNAQWQEGVTRTCFKCLGNIILRMKHVLPTDILFTYFFSLFKKWPVLVVLIKSYLIILQFWATQNKFLVSYPFNSEKWSARADSNFIFYFFLYRESWMKMAWFTKTSQFAWFTKPSQFATGSEHGGIAYTFEVDNW